MPPQSLYTDCTSSVSSGRSAVTVWVALAPKANSIPYVSNRTGTCTASNLTALRGMLGA
jgi:hypothetical protein